MSTLAWKLRRLQAMSGDEIAHRLWIALRDRFAPARYETMTSIQAFEHLFDADEEQVLRYGRLDRLTQFHPGASGLDDAAEAGRRLMYGRWLVFGHEVRLDDPPVWNRNPIDGREWPDVSAHKIDYRRPDVAGGVKWTWELGRLTMLPTFALAYRITEDEIYSQRCQNWLEDWNETNPFGHGVHYTSGIEMAVRVLTVTWTLSLLGERASGHHIPTTLGLLAQQALHCRDHLSKGSSANNHLLAEYAAMTVLAATFPLLEDSKSLFRQGIDGLEAETLRQIHPDGVPAEQAFRYLPFIWELLLYPFIAAKAAGHQVAAPVRERLRASLEFARAMRSDTGELPPIGDEDDGRILLADCGASRVDRVGNAMAAWLGAPPLTTDDALARVLWGKRGGVPESAPDLARTFADGGYTVWRDRELLVTLDHGPLGYLSIAAHGHADALSMTVRHGADAIVVDPGTFAYHADPAARDRCRSTPVHATIHFGGRSQSEMLGPFMWGRRASVTSDGEAHQCRWHSGETHARRVEVDPGVIRIHDEVNGSSPHLVFPLAPGADVEVDGHRAVVRSGHSIARIETDAADTWNVDEADVAPAFGRVKRAPRLAAAMKGSSAVTQITIESTRQGGTDA